MIISMPMNFSSGIVFVDGERNEIGLTFDYSNEQRRTLWGIDNSADKLYRQDLGGDMSND
jgi:hypothetical protein